MPRRLSPEKMLTVTLDAICSRNRYTESPAAVVAELYAAAGDRVDLLQESVGTWVYAALYCNELTDPEVVEVTRNTYMATVDDAQFDAILATCASTPDALFEDVMRDAIRAATVLSLFDQTVPVTDTEGYTFDLVVDYALTGLTADPSTQPPGLTAAVPKITLTMSIANTTPQRDLTFKEVSGIVSPLDYPTFLVSAEFNAGNPVCTQVRQTDRACNWPLGFGRMESGTTVTQGSVYTLKTYGGMPNGGTESAYLAAVPEASWAELEPLLKNPDGFQISYSGGDGRRFTSLCEKNSLVPVLVNTSGICP